MGCVIQLRYGRLNDLNTVFFRTALSTTSCTSTFESELGASNFAAKGTMGLRNVVFEVFNDFQGYVVLSPGLSGDNTAANMLSSNSSGTRSARHLSLQNFYVRGLAIRGL